MTEYYSILTENYKFVVHSKSKQKLDLLLKRLDSGYYDGKILTFTNDHQFVILTSRLVKSWSKTKSITYIGKFTKYFFLYELRGLANDAIYLTITSALDYPKGNFKVRPTYFNDQELKRFGKDQYFCRTCFNIARDNSNFVQLKQFSNQDFLLGKTND